MFYLPNVFLQSIKPPEFMNVSVQMLIKTKKQKTDTPAKSDSLTANCRSRL